MKTYSLGKGLKKTAEFVKNNRKLVASLLFVGYVGAVIAVGELVGRPYIDSLIERGPFNMGGNVAAFELKLFLRDYGIRIAEVVAVATATLLYVFMMSVDYLKKPE
jgi:hypothetical protein